MSTKENANNKVLTPAGPIYVKYASEAAEYRKLYGYSYMRISNEEGEL